MLDDSVTNGDQPGLHPCNHNDAPRSANDADGPEYSKSSRDDQREAMFNEGHVGPANRIQLPAERITSLRGVMIDLDPGKLRPNNGIFEPATEPEQFFDRIGAVIDSHPLARYAEVRATGTGLHLLLWFEPQVELNSDADRQRWRGIVRAIQASLPSDGHAPDLTALTRPPRSINSKTGRDVSVLRPGRPISPQQAIEYLTALRNAPFRTVVNALFRADRVDPCPFCGDPNAPLSILDRKGLCYRCGTVQLDMIFDLILQQDDVANDPPHGRSGRRGDKQSSAASA